MKVEIRPLPITKWHGKTGKDEIAQPLVLECLMDGSGKYMTGLTPEEEVEYGEKLGTTLSSNFKFDEAHPFYSTRQAKLVLPYQTTIFDTTNPMDFVKIKYAKHSRFIASSMKAWENGESPDAVFVMMGVETPSTVAAVTEVPFCLTGLNVVASIATAVNAEVGVVEVVFCLTVNEPQT